MGLDFFVGLCFYVDGPKDAAAAPPDPCRQPPAVGPFRRRPANIDPGSTPPSSARVVCLGFSGPQFGEAGCREVSVEGERLRDSLGTHEGEAGGVDKRVLALVVLAEPKKRFRLELTRYEVDRDVSVDCERIQELDCPPVPALATKPCPALTAYVIGGDHRATADLRRKLNSLGVVRIACVETSDQKRGIDEYQGGGFKP